MNFLKDNFCARGRNNTMQRTVSTISALLLSASAVTAGGLDRTGQPMDIIFETGNYAEFAIGRANPDVSGSDVPALNPFQTPTGDVANGFNQVAAGVKFDVNERLSFSLIYEQPWGSDVRYPFADANPTTPGSILLGGTSAIASSDSATHILRYKFDDNWSAHGGIRAQNTRGNIDLRGLAYGRANGFSINVRPDTAWGWVAGGAYEIPEIALRVALTYQSEIEHDFDTQELIPGIPVGVDGSTKTKTPQSVNLDFQTGVAENTLVFGGIRWAEHSVTKLVAPVSGLDLIDIDDSWTFDLGVAQRLNENWVASIAFGYETESDDNLVSPLAPTNGFESVSLGLQYTQGNIKVSGGVRYAFLGDAIAETGTPDVGRTSFTDNDVVSFGLRVGYYF
jgi:long-subunit fatty acid transport protein